MSVPPRIHVLTATQTDFAVILRRGPAREVATLGWHRETDEIELAQWMKARLKEYQSDLSPDGRHMIYFAASGGQARTVLSRAPWLHAIEYCPQDSYWGGGGAFDAEGRVAGAGPAPPDGLTPILMPLGTDGFHMGDGFAGTQVRRGWSAEGHGYDVVLKRALSHGWTLVARPVIGATDRALVSLDYGLAHADHGEIAQPDWTWADVWKDGLHIAAQGVIQFAQVTADGGLSDRRVIADLTDMTFERRRAPYDDRPEDSA